MTLRACSNMWTSASKYRSSMIAEIQLPLAYETRLQAIPTRPCVPSKRNRPESFCAIAAGASVSPSTSDARFQIRSAVGLSAAVVYVKTIACPVTPRPVSASMSTRGNSAAVPLAVPWGCVIGTRTALTFRPDSNHLYDCCPGLVFRIPRPPIHRLSMMKPWAESPNCYPARSI